MKFPPLHPTLRRITDFAPARSFSILSKLLFSLALAIPVAAQVTDSDADGLPDSWEIQHFSNLAQNGSGDFDSDTVPNSLEFSAGRNPTLEQTVVGVPDWHGVPGALRMERWNGVFGLEVVNLTSAASFPQSPSVRGFVTQANSGLNVGDNIGVRWRGTLTAPVTGQYRFHVAADDSAQVFFSNTPSRFDKNLICRVDSWVGAGNYTANAAQRSELISLVSGQSYYVEVLMKEGGVGDHLSLAWTLPNTTTPVVIPGLLADGRVVLTSEVPDPLDADDDGLLDSWELAQGLNPASASEHALKDTDGDGFSNLREYQTSGSALVRGGNVGSIEWHLFSLPPHDNTLRSLTGNAIFAQSPAAKGYYTRSEADQNTGTNFGRRIRGVVTIPTTGTYHFYVVGDEACALWVNVAGESRFGKQIVAFANVARSVRAFTPVASQKSQALSLTAGQRVYIEALHIEGNGSDHCSIGWSGPPSASPVLIAPSQLSVCKDELIAVNGTAFNNDVDDDSLPDDWEFSMGLLITNSGTAAQLNGEYGDPDGDGVPNFVEYQNGTNPMTASGVAGKWAHELYMDVAGGRVIDMLGNAGVLGGADSFRLSDSTEFYRNRFANYGERFRSTITAPITGNYTFWISGDDGVELWLSSDDRKFNKRKLAAMDDMNAGYHFSAFREWDKNPGQMSKPVALVAGQQYYIEAMHKGSGGIEHVSVAWSAGNSIWAGGYLPSTGDGVRLIEDSQLSSVTSGQGTVNGPWVVNKKEATTYFFVNNGTTASLQLQFYDGWRTYAAKVELRQIGASVFARQVYARMVTGANVLGQNFDVITSQTIRLGAVGLGVDGLMLVNSVGGFNREVLPSSQLTSYVRDASDLDDDYLPDAWEISHGLSAVDNGFILAANGEYGDPDADSLSNRDEWLLGTDPTGSDTDGDGYADGQEVYFIGTNPLVAELANPSVIGDVELQAIAAASASWVPTPEGGVVSMATRGWIDYPLTVTTAGYYLFEIRGKARGAAVRTREDFLLDVIIDGEKVATTTLTCVNGNQGMAGGFAGWLSAGSHTLRIWNHNLLARRTLQLDSLRIVKPSGADVNGDGLADWIEQFLTARSGSNASASGSFTSPFCLEGFSRNWESASVAVDGSAAVPVQRGVNGNWFANVPLQAAGTGTPVSVYYENGLLLENFSVDWTPFNVSAMGELTIRKDDSMRLTAFPAGTSPGSWVVSYALNGLNIGSQPADQPMIYTFAAVGKHTLTATYSGPSGLVTSTSVIEVLSADFGPTFPIYINRTRLWNIPTLAADLPVENDSSLQMARQTVASGSRFHADTTKLGSSFAIARTRAQGPVLARGQVEGILLSHSDSNEIYSCAS